MVNPPKQISLKEWDRLYDELKRNGLREPFYGGSLRRHLANRRDFRLDSLRFDNSAAALRLWNFLLTEEDRLHKARAEGKKLVGAMKDLGTVPVMAWALKNVAAFYPDGAWWIPCVMEFSDGLLRIADSLGIDESFCPVRAMLGAFITQDHFPIPDLITCSAGATCDDFSAIAQRLNALGHNVLWWEIPSRRAPEPGEPAVDLPGGFRAPIEQVNFVKAELDRVRSAIEQLAGERLDDATLSASIGEANHIRRCLNELRQMVFSATVCPLPALEILIAEMLAIHYCSDRVETMAVLNELLIETQRRIETGIGLFDSEAVRVFWVNPVADLRVMNVLEECGGRLCGTDFMFCHAIDIIPEDLPPMDALAQMALADPMVGPATDRANRICADIRAIKAEAVVVSRIPGASHCAYEGQTICRVVQSQLGLPALEIEVPPVCDSILPSLRTRIEALAETVKNRRQP